MRIGRTMRLVLRCLAGTPGAERQAVSALLSRRLGIGSSAAYSAIQRCGEAGLLSSGRRLSLTDAGRRHLRHRLAWWGGPVAVHHPPG